MHTWHDRESGSVMVAAMVLVTLMLIFVLVTLAITTLKVTDANASTMNLSARFVAKAGLEMQVNDLRNMRDLATLESPYATFDDMDPDPLTGPGHFSQTYDTSPVFSSGGDLVGEFDVVVDVQNQGSGGARDVVIAAFGYVPSKAAFQANSPGAARVEMKSVSRVQVSASEVFDYSYFINHWGWFYGNTIIANGSVRANGQFDFGGYGATVNGSPRYAGANGWDLVGYQDDNNDGVTDGSDGGAYAGWNVVGAENVQGMVANPDNQHAWSGSAPMPNLSDLGSYETMAISEGGTISHGGTVLVSGVLGDDVGEKQSLFLVGTVADPIVLDGPVVVRGDVILSGVVSGQGTVFSGRNAYVPGNISYANAPVPARPVANDEATVEQWRQDNAGADALGLFAREHVVIGDYTDANWQYYVDNWVNHPLNKSAEDAGADGIQNTKAGPDGILGTADDDLLEDDGVWTVDQYTQADADAGLIPPGFAVGDAIPGSGEDLDGDGAYDGATQMSEFDIGSSLDPANWAGLNQSHAGFGDISTVNIDHIDGSFYTNHTLAALMLAFGQDIVMNGAIVSRNESIVYGADHIIMNHDERLTGGSGADSYGLHLPVSWEPVEVKGLTIHEGAGVDPYVGGGS